MIQAAVFRAERWLRSPERPANGGSFITHTTIPNEPNAKQNKPGPKNKADTIRNAVSSLTDLLRVS